MDGQRKTRKDLYPAVEPYTKGMLALDDLHQMYWEECGNPAGIPVISLHGGPGAGSNSTHRRFFDPKRYRIILYDQRGSGRSRPYASTENNTTQHLVADIETLRQHLSIEKWMVLGGSWGSTLALCYAIAHSERCTGIVLRGVFLGRDSELDWFMEGIGNIFPEPLAAFRHFLPENERGALLDSYHKRLNDPDPSIHLPASLSWNLYETNCSTLTGYTGGPIDTNFGRLAVHGALALARIEAHYFVNHVFIDDDYILRNVDKIRHIPAVIVQGRYDIVCPIRTADQLATAWPEANYRIIPDAGHSALEAGIRAALVEATDTLPGLFR